MSIADGVFALAVAMGVSGLLVDGVVRMVPERNTEDFFQVHEIKAVRDGDGANLFVDRSILMPIHMGFTVRVMEKTPTGWRQYCGAPADPFLYQPDAVLDQPVTLDWWTWGKCPTLPEGPARIVTTWTPTARGLQPLSYTVEVTE